MDIENRWLSAREAAGYLGVEPDTVYRWIRERGFPAHRIGKLWKMKTCEIDTWVLTVDSNLVGSDLHSLKKETCSGKE